MTSGAVSLPVRARSLMVVVLVGFAGPANADSVWYSCHDAKGKSLSGQWPPEGCVGEICETNPATGARKCTPPPETPEQRRKREEIEKRKSECEKKNHDKHLDEVRFLDKYWSDDIIENERNGALAEQHRRIDDAKLRLAKLKAEKKKHDDAAEFYEATTILAQGAGMTCHLCARKGTVFMRVSGKESLGYRPVAGPPRARWAAGRDFEVVQPCLERSSRAPGE